MPLCLVSIHYPANPGAHAGTPGEILKEWTVQKKSQAPGHCISWSYKPRAGQVAWLKLSVRSSSHVRTAGPLNSCSHSSTHLLGEACHSGQVWSVHKVDTLLVRVDLEFFFKFRKNYVSPYIGKRRMHLGGGASLCGLPGAPNTATVAATLPDPCPSAPLPGTVG